MNPSNLSERARRLIALAVEEDAPAGDLTTRLLGIADRRGSAVIASKAEGILAGVAYAHETFRYVDTALHVELLATDGDRLTPGKDILRVEGKAGALLLAERPALNFLQHLSGIATHAQKLRGFVPGHVQLTDTRKTHPGMREAEKSAVTAGGLHNHRMNLSDAVLIKDNHLILGGGDIGALVARAKSASTGGLPVEVEVERIDQIKLVLDAGADVLLLDNFSDDQIIEAVQIIDGRAKIEVSGGMSIERFRTLPWEGIDRVSMGSIVYGAGWLDLHMRVESK